MWILRISLDLYGDDFSPKEFLKEIDVPIKIFSINESNDLIDLDKDKTYEFGSLSIVSPSLYGLQNEISEYENWYFDFIDTNQQLIVNNKVNEINLFIDVFHDEGQLNFEIFSRELLKKVAKYDIAIPISYHNINTDQLIEMLNETHYPKDIIDNYIKEG